ncbi:MAG: response regulator transcription factor [Chloroflexi bacterium]|nr:response regulator transcription factor [Chloroflexota bacterium]
MTSRVTVLVVDDERNIVQLIKLYLSKEGYQVETAYDGQEALTKCRTGKPSLVLLDLMMPGLDGWEVCRQLRRESDIPIIILTARNDDVDKIVGLELGADDYLTKPFNPRELVARVKAVLRRYQVGVKPTRVLELGNLRIDPERREATVEGKPLNLRAKEFDLLATFARNVGIVLSRERLLDLIWGYDYEGDLRTIDVHITWLREKLVGSTVQIQTVWGIGYKLIPSATEKE